MRSDDVEPRFAMSIVKSERQDDREINELAIKILEQNRTKLHQQQAAAAQLHHQTNNSLHMLTRQGQQPLIQNYLTSNRAVGSAVSNSNYGSATTAVNSSGTTTSSGDGQKLDAESRRGRFGWCEFEKNYIPFIFRGNGDRYASVRMVERKFLGRFLSVLPPEVNSCHCIRSYYITEAESKLLNEINLRHADCYFGKEPFTTKDLVVRLRDAKEFYRFLDLCYKKLVLKKSNSSDRCGFFRINGESVVPYTVRGSVKFVPLFYFEGETDHLKLKSDQVEGWDLAYLKFCCKVQGIRNELFAADTCRVVALEEIKGHFPPGTTFEDYWPAKGSIEPINTQRNPAGNWTQKPPSATGGSAAAAASNGVKHHNLPMAAAAAAAAAAASFSGRSQPPTSATANGYDLASQSYQQMLRATQMQTALSQQLPAYAAAAAGYHHAAAAAAAAASSSSSSSGGGSSSLSNKQFPGKLTQIKEFPMERSHQPPYKLQKALIDQKIVPCINVRPYVFHDLMMTLPDFVKNFCPELTMERSQQILQEILKIVLYKGNK